MIERAPAKINLCLVLGPARADRRHELITVFDAVSLYDELTIEPATRDEVVCEGVTGPNLVGEALAALRAAGWAGPPLRVTIDKRIPVAAGMGGGSADAAALLRAATALDALPTGVSLPRLAAQLGADVPSQLAPGLCLGTGAGDVIDELPPVDPYGAVVVPAPFGLSTADVYREADRLGLARPYAELGRWAAELRAGLQAHHVVNDLEPAAISLAPAIAQTLQDVADAGADRALVCGSGPTVIGLCWGDDGEHRAVTVAQRLRERHRDSIAVSAVGAGVGLRAPNE